MFNFEDKDSLEYAGPEDVYKYCNHYDLFRHYVGNFTIGRPILSPLAPEKKPSFAIFVKGDKILFNDFRLGGGDIIKFLMMRDGLTFREAINKIIHDSDLGDKFRSDNDYTVKPLIAYNKKIEYTKPQINVKRRNWAVNDVDFWKSFGIGQETLIKYRVSPIKYIFFGQKIIVAEKYAYCFTEQKDGIDTFTIYQPFSKDNKWFKSHDASVFYGWSQLPETGDVLVITKSMKDVMTIDACMGTPTVALQSERTKPKKHIIQELKDRFKSIYLLYDNDYDNEVEDKPNYGRKFGNELCIEFGIIQIEIPDHLAIKYQAKDLSDLAKGGGREYVCNILDEPHRFKV